MRSVNPPLLVPSIIAALAVCAAASPTEHRTPAKAKQGSPPTASTEVQQTLAAAFADDKLLRLSMGGDGAGDRFEFLITLAIPGKDGRRHASRYLVARDGDEMAALVLSQRNSPFAYVTQGLMAGFDLAEPGTLILSGKGAPRFEFSLGEEGDNVDVELSFARNLERPQLRLELGPFLRAALENAKRMDFNADRRMARFATEKSSMLVVLSPEGEAARFGVSGVIMKTRPGLALSLSNVRVGGKRSAILGLKMNDFLRLGLPTRVAGNDDEPKVPLFVPPTFEKHAVERRAAEGLRELFPRISSDETRGTPLDNDAPDKNASQGNLNDQP